jgi:hypothetical protein
MPGIPIIRLISIVFSIRTNANDLSATLLVQVTYIVNIILESSLLRIHQREAVQLSFHEIRSFAFILRYLTVLKRHFRKEIVCYPSASMS